MIAKFITWEKNISSLDYFLIFFTLCGCLGITLLVTKSLWCLAPLPMMCWRWWQKDIAEERARTIQFHQTMEKLNER